MAYRRRMPRRGPRPEELALLKLLESGPTPVLDGPLGRCMKRGWRRSRMCGDHEMRGTLDLDIGCSCQLIAQ
jgi:hypothetical protein